MLPITLIAVTSIRITETISALRKCYEKLDFEDIKLISHEEVILPGNIKFEACPKLNSVNDYSQYIFRELDRHVKTSHCLLIQYDSWILNHNSWNNDWLQYDYIGAPWPVVENSYMANNGERVRVGNGGFSLRSKKLLGLPKKLNLQLKQEQGYYNEDGNICCYYRKEFLDENIKYAPIDIAAKFSFETYLPENKGIQTFGFHRNQPSGIVYL